MSPIPPEITLATIETSAKQFAADRASLAESVAELNDQIETLKRRAIPRLKRLVNAAAQSQANLSAQVDQARHLFQRPRTVIFHGIRVGLRKGSGAVDWDDDATVVALILKHFKPAEADLLIKTTRKPIAKALQDLDVATLKKLGCRVEATGDQVVTAPADSHVDKLVNALLKDAVEEATTT